MKQKVLKLLLFVTLLSSSLYGALEKTEVSMLYVTIFNRASEGSGNQYWQDNGVSMEETATAMLNTPDAKTYFGDSLNLNQAFVEYIYKNTLNKTYADDKDGIDYWVGLLNSGTSRGVMIANLVKAATEKVNAGDAQEQFNNRVAVSNYMADTIKPLPSDYATSTSFSSGLRVTSDNSTVNTAKQSVNSLADKTAPVITITGDNPVNVVQNKTYIDKGATATDNVDGDITTNIEVTSNVDTSVEGNYTVTYEVSDSSGNKANIVTRTVIVVKNTVNLKDGLVAHYEFEGNANDSSGNGNDGVEYGEVSYVDGVIGKAVALNKPNDYINIDESFKFNDYTVSYFVKVNNYGNLYGNGGYGASNEILSGANEDNDNAFEFYFTDDKKIAFCNESLGCGKSAESIDFLKQWVFVSYVRKNNKITVYLNNKKLYSYSSSKNGMISIDNLVIGKDQDCVGGCFSDNQSVLGLIDDLRIYNRALNEVEIKELYKLGQVKEIVNLKDGLVAHYEFEGNANDSSGNGHHGIEYGNISYIANNNKQAMHCNNGGIKTLTSYFDKDWAINTNRAEATTYFHDISNQSKSQTISVWFKTTEYNLEEWGGGIVSISNNSSRIGISIKENFLQVEYGTDSDFIIKELSSTIINDGLWKHVVIVSNGDNGEKKVYVNGVFKLTFNNGYNSNALKGYYRICGYTLYNRGYKNNYHGDIDNLRIYNRALTETEIQELYNLKQ